MPKIKSVSGARKRFKRTAAGYKRKQSHLRHILSKKSSKRKRQLGDKLAVHPNDVQLVRRMLPYD